MPRLTLEEMRKTIKEGQKLDILSLGKYWSEIHECVYERFKDDSYVASSWEAFNYRIHVPIEPEPLTKGCLSDSPKSLPAGYLF